MRDTVSDETLALSAANGDANAFAQLVERVYGRVFTLAFRLSGNRAEAEDLCQDICEALPRKLQKYDQRARFTTWLYRVTVNAAEDRRRRLFSHSRAAQAWGEVEIAERAEAEINADAVNWLETAMNHLPDDLRQTTVLVLEPLTHAEVAEVLDVSEGTVSWRMSEVKKRLRAMKEAEA